MIGVIFNLAVSFHAKYSLLPCLGCCSKKWKWKNKGNPYLLQNKIWMNRSYISVLYKEYLTYFFFYCSISRKPTFYISKHKLWLCGLKMISDFGPPLNYPFKMNSVLHFLIQLTWLWAGDEIKAAIVDLSVLQGYPQTNQFEWCGVKEDRVLMGRHCHTPEIGAHSLLFICLFCFN